MRQERSECAREWRTALYKSNKQTTIPSIAFFFFFFFYSADVTTWMLNRRMLYSCCLLWCDKETDTLRENHEEGDTTQLCELCKISQACLASEYNNCCSSSCYSVSQMNQWTTLCICSCDLTNAFHRVKELRVSQFCFNFPRQMGSHTPPSEDSSPVLEGGCCYWR